VPIPVPALSLRDDRGTAASSGAMRGSGHSSRVGAGSNPAPEWAVLDSNHPANRDFSGGGDCTGHCTRRAFPARTGVCCLREIRRGFRKLPDGIAFVPGDYDWW
jgi:hypothetical protein